MKFKYISKFIGTFLFSLLLVGCQTTEPLHQKKEADQVEILDTEHKKEEDKISYLNDSENNSTEDREVENNNKLLQKKINNKVVEKIEVKTYEVPEATLEREGKVISPDPNVKLIAPPTSIPKQNYSIIPVEEKEDFNPALKIRSNKNKSVSSGGLRGKFNNKNSISEEKIEFTNVIGKNKKVTTLKSTSKNKTKISNSNNSKKPIKNKKNK